MPGLLRYSSDALATRQVRASSREVLPSHLSHFAQVLDALC